MTRAALVVGINTYTHFRDLKAPAQDAEAIAQQLQQDGEFKVTRLPEALTRADERLSPTVGETLAVTQAQLEAALKQLFRPSSDQYPDTALFYFSGHGLPDTEGYDQGYLATSDTDPDHPRLAISLRWLHWLLSDSPIPNQIVWLDCCHSGGLLIDVQAANPGHSAGCSRCFIASSRDFEQSWQDLNSPYSVLTKALLEGLDPMRLPGRWVDTFALVDYVNHALKGELQTPTCTNFGDAINLTRTWQVEDATVQDTATNSGICPYKGLEFFDLNDEDPKYFFGREALTNQLLDQVRTTNFIALVGASGNGKSSVLRAGLLHQLRLGRRIAGSEQWQIIMMRPDAQPMKNLATAFLPADGSQLDRAEALGRAEGLLREGGAGLARLVEAAPADRVVLVVDQFEEVFTRCDDINEREQFFACLMGALQETGDKLCLIIAMRSDFVGKCLERDYSGLAQHVQENMISVLPMQPEELRDAIWKPAAQVGLTVEDALVTQMLNDIQGAPGSLPLLQYTLKELWQRRRDNQLVLSAYQALGGINGTLDKRATELYESFDPDQQRTVRHIFQQLTQLGEGTEDTRRRVFLDNLISEPLHPAERVKTVVERLADKDNRLLVTSEVVSKDDLVERRAIVDVAHEALIRHWRLLRQWIEQNRDLLRQQRRIEASAVTWQEHEKSKGYLLQGLPLDEAMQFQKQQAETFPLSDAARAFIQRSRWQRRRNQLKTASWLIIPAAIVLGVVEHNIREEGVKADYARLDSSSRYEEKQAVEALVRGCQENQYFNWLPDYLTERIWGNCRFLTEAPLEEADLSNADLVFANLRHANLDSANLSGANLSGAFLNGANLSNADLSFTVFNLADLRYANLSNTDLSSASLNYAILSNADFSNADLSGAGLERADLRHADLSGANLSSHPMGNTNLSDANLSDASLRSADLSNVNLSGANLSGANLNRADLISADFNSANLSGANLSGAIIGNTDLSNANLSDANLNNAIFIAIDLRNTTNLTSRQLGGDNAPYLCNAGLPSTITNINPKHDCEALPEVLTERYGIEPEYAQQIVNEAIQIIWEE